jgi:beta-N-acetylhexosaminidase
VNIVKKKLEQLNLHQKIGQLLVIGFPENYVNHSLEEAIKKYHFGNIILFQKNIIDSVQLVKLNKSIQKIMEKYNRIPGFISIDQEGGMVTRLTNKATHFPGNMAIAAGTDYETTYKLGAAMGEELRSVGVNINFAPVLDINNNPENPVIGVRSYGDVPEVVAHYGRNFINGLQSKGVIAFGKHFPGHGNTKVDSHLGLASIDSNLQQLKEVELVPFVSAIDNNIDGIMTAHIMFPELEKDALPATLSRSIITGLLREELGFKGLVITDCMEMNAIAGNYGFEYAVVKALQAGVDLLCISHTRELQIRAFNAIEKAVEDGSLSLQQIDEKVNRILYYKEKYYIYNWMRLSREINQGKLRFHEKLAEAVSENSITLIKDEKSLLPLHGKALICISPVSQGIAHVDDNIEEVNLAEKVHEIIGGDYINYDLKAIKEEEILSKIAGTEVIIFGSYNMSLYSNQKCLFDKIVASGKDIILVALRNPYDVSEYKDKVSTILCSYEYTKLSVKSLIKVLNGEITAVGKLPVKI